MVSGSSFLGNGGLSGLVQLVNNKFSALGRPLDEELVTTGKALFSFGGCV